MLLSKFISSNKSSKFKLSQNPSATELSSPSVQLMFGDSVPQYVIKNILLIHNRHHPKKRMYVKDENNPHSFINQKNNNFQEFLKLSKENIQKLITGQGKFKEYQDLKNILEK